MFGDSQVDLPHSETIQEHWANAGLVGYGPNGITPLSWQELAAFAALCDYNVSKIELSVIIDMSRAYVDGFNDKNPLSIAPMERRYG